MELIGVFKYSILGCKRLYRGYLGSKAEYHFELLCYGNLAVLYDTTLTISVQDSVIHFNSWKLVCDSALISSICKIFTYFHELVKK